MSKTSRQPATKCVASAGAFRKKNECITWRECPIVYSNATLTLFYAQILNIEQLLWRPQMFDCFQLWFVSKPMFFVTSAEFVLKKIDDLLLYVFKANTQATSSDVMDFSVKDTNAENLHHYLQCFESKLRIVTNSDHFLICDSLNALILNIDNEFHFKTYSIIWMLQCVSSKTVIFIKTRKDYNFPSEVTNRA